MARFGFRNREEFSPRLQKWIRYYEQLNIKHWLSKRR
jgi:hypothetical protein